MHKRLCQPHTRKCVIKEDLKDTDFCLLACGGHPLSPPINSPDNTAHIKGITYLSDYGVIMVCLGGAKKGQSDIN